MTNIPGAPEPHRTPPDEEDWRAWRDSTERDVADYQRDRRARDAMQWAYDHRLPEGR